MKGTSRCGSKGYLLLRLPREKSKKKSEIRNPKSEIRTQVLCFLLRDSDLFRISDFGFLLEVPQDPFQRLHRQADHVAATALDDTDIRIVAFLDGIRSGAAL